MESEQERLATVTLPLGARALGRALSQLRLAAEGVRVVSLRRSNGRTIDPATDPALEDGDTLVLSGRPETLAIAEEILLNG
jgi:CPA2 family monovalent cation:H+ antiporter-2